VNEIAGQASRGSTQPSPYVDRRALSQAWYSALFDARRVSGASPAGMRTGLPTNEAAAAASDRANLASLAVRPARTAPAKATRFRLARAGFATDARARAGKPPAELALRPAVRRALWHRTLCRTTLREGHAVDLLVQQRGDLLRLIAIYDGRDAGLVSAGLLRARAALVQRGLRVEFDARQKGTS
jgi:hypothetical protein